MAITLYGIKNCDTMKKTFQWLDAQNVAYEFHDYKKHGIDKNVVSQAINQHGWENVLNKRGTTWRNLEDGIKTNMDNIKALQVAEENPSIVKRPLLLYKNQTYLGFKQEIYEKIFA